MHAPLEEILVQCETFRGISAHTGDLVKNYGITFFQLFCQFAPCGPVCGRAGVLLRDDHGLRVLRFDILDLSLNILLHGTDSAVSV